MSSTSRGQFGDSSSGAARRKDGEILPSALTRYSASVLTPYSRISNGDCDHVTMEYPVRFPVAQLKLRELHVLGLEVEIPLSYPYLKEQYSSSPLVC